jgi:uncharacterized protein with HEPN domain
MKRDPRAFLADVIDAGHAISQAVHGISLDDYCNSRLIRSSVEREFIIISFRNKLTHEYVTINDQLVWGVIQQHLQALCTSCKHLLQQLEAP